MLVFNFDVLAIPGPDVISRQPSAEGRFLWKAFHTISGGNMAIVCDEEYPSHLFEAWLVRERLKASTYHFLDTKDPAAKAEKVHLFSNTFGRANWYIDIDPRTVALTISKGIPSLLVGAPYTIRPEWETEKPITPWSDLVEEADRQNLRKAQKSWSNWNEEDI